MYNDTEECVNKYEIMDILGLMVDSYIYCCCGLGKNYIENNCPLISAAKGLVINLVLK